VGAFPKGLSENLIQPRKSHILCGAFVYLPARLSYLSGTGKAKEGKPTSPGGKHILLLALVGTAVVCIAWAVRTGILAQRRAQIDAAAEQRFRLQQAAMQISALHRRILLHPDDLQAHRELASLYAQDNMPDQLVAELETLARLQPKDIQAQLALASACGALKRWPEAVSSYLSIVKTWPQAPAGWQGLSVTFYGMKQYEKAMVAARRAYRLQPDDLRNRFGLAASTLQWAIETNRAGNRLTLIGQEQQELTRLLPGWPDKAGIHYLLGHAYAASNKVDLAISHLEEADRLQPESADIAFGLGRVYLREQRYADGRRVVQRALTADPSNADLLELMGRLWQDSGEAGAQQQALPLFEQAAKSAPENPQFQEQLGSAYLQAGRLDDARHAFETTLKFDPNRPFPYQQLAVIYARSGDRQRAAQIAQAAKEVEFNAEQLKMLQAMVATHPEDVGLHLQLADRYRVLGLNGLAQDEYLAAKQQDPHNAHAEAGLKALQAQVTARSGH